MEILVGIGPKPKGPPYMLMKPTIAEYRRRFCHTKISRWDHPTLYSRAEICRSILNLHAPTAYRQTFGKHRIQSGPILSNFEYCNIEVYWAQDAFIG